MTKYNIVVIDKGGVIIGIQEYDPVNDGHRDKRIGVAIDTLAGRLGMMKPIGTLKRSLTTDNGVDWCKMGGDFEVGMTEIGFGKWGFER